MTIDNASSINVDGRGYLGAMHNGNGETGRTVGITSGAVARSGGSYGGLGGVLGGPTNPIYGSLTDPADLGSGGAGGVYNARGGDGGGYVAITATNIVLNGSISANGDIGAGNQAGSGSGGTINIRTATLSGTGTITANGGAGQVGGGGGRIAIRYVDLSTMDTSGIRALGGQGGNAKGGNGTVYYLSSTQEKGDLLIDGNNALTPEASTEIPQGYVFDNIMIRNRARVFADSPIVVNSTFRLLEGSVLTHTAGLGHSFSQDGVDRWYHREGALAQDSLREGVNAIARVPLAFQPGTRWRYSLALEVLARLIEVVSGQSFEAFLQERLFGPLGMADAVFLVPQDKLDRLPQLCVYKDGKLGIGQNPLDGSDWITTPKHARGSGSLVCSTQDYLRFAQMLLNGGVLDSVRILGRKTVELMTLNHLTPEALTSAGARASLGPGVGFGLGGCTVMDVAQRGMAGWPGGWGWGGAAGTYFMIDPLEDMLLILMTQLLGAGIGLVFGTLAYQALVD